MPPLLLLPTPLTSFQIGLRAASRALETSTAPIAVPSSRLFSTSRPSPFYPRPCSQYSRRSVVCPSATTLHANARWRNSLPLPHVQLRTFFKFRAITRYIDLPEWYEDAKGLPFRREELTQKEANGIFPSNLPAPEANLLLKIVHGRRVAGTLNDPNLAENTKQFKVGDQKRALEYLRQHIPVDEVLNAGLRAEDELAVLAERTGAADDAEEQIENTSLGGTPSTANNEPENVLTGRLPRKPASDTVYGESSFDRIRAENIAKREAEEARLAEEQRLQEEELAKQNIGTLQTEQAKPREMSEFRRKHFERATSDLEAPPEMSASQRLLPAFGLTLLVVIGSVGFAALYEPPSKSRRIWPDIPPAAATCMSLIAMNIAVWGLWKFPPAWKFMNQYLILVAATPRPVQLLGAMFSHQTVSHLAANMTFLWLFGTRVHDEIGRGNFLALYLSSGALGFAASLTHSVLWRGLHCTTLGASGAVYGLIAAFFWLHKFDEFKILGYPPDPISGPQGLGFLGLIVGMHLIPMVLGRATNIDMMSHFAGLLVGVVGIDLARKHMDSKARARAERLESVGVRNTAIIEEKRIAPIVGASSSSSADQ
ncbi:hypothetical protein GGR50DRAFT_661031 [Xylaria sp. CBS 124048]|nr:hypothetical protein GGR50DRAFT_661031 [Xylaria sp. CBS 124048]